MNSPTLAMQQQFDLLQGLDIGLIIIDTQYRVKLLNAFITNHTAIEQSNALERSIFELFDSLPRDYLSRKFDSVIALQTSLTITWQQRPHLFVMESFRSITSSAKYMYQNVKIQPLLDSDGQVEHLAIAIYDVTEAARTQQVFEEQNKKLRLSNRVDPLTQVYNRGYWEYRLQAEFKRFSRAGVSSVLAMLDIDHFKLVNDKYGHQGGDAVLRHIGKLLHQYRDTDIIGRYGGEEFGILLLDTTVEKARVILERLRHKIEETTVTHENREISVTASLGISQISTAFDSHEQWIDLADRALYQSKESGRNRLTILSHPNAKD
ncbi:MAG: GGDEF domain-containing protein [Pseudomonadales bacterium]